MMQRSGAGWTTMEADLASEADARRRVADLLWLGRWSEARRALIELVRMRPTDMSLQAHLHYADGRTLAEHDNIAGARAASLRALEADPTLEQTRTAAASLPAAGKGTGAPRE